MTGFRDPAASRRYTENIVVSHLRSLGYWAQTGKSASAPAVDLVVDGMLWLEIKHARLQITASGAEEFKFAVTPKQRAEGFRTDLVLLVCEWEPDQYTFHVFPANDPVFYLDRGDGRRLKNGFTYRPGRETVKQLFVGEILTETRMRAAQDAWSLLERVREVFRNRLRAGLPVRGELWR